MCLPTPLWAPAVQPAEQPLGVVDKALCTLLPAVHGHTGLHVPHGPPHKGQEHVVRLSHVRVYKVWGR